MCGTRHTFANAQIKYFAGVAEYNGTQVQSEPAKVYAEWFPDRSWGIAHGYGTKHIPIANAVRLGLRLLVTKESNPRPIDRIVEFRKTANPTVCNAKCRSARGPMCDCSCGGQNHGISVAMSRTRFAEGYKGFVDPWAMMSPEDRRMAGKLQIAALRAMPSSPRQREIRGQLMAILSKYELDKQPEDRTARFAMVSDLKISKGRDEDSRVFTAVVNGSVIKGKLVKGWSRLGGWGWTASIEGVDATGGAQMSSSMRTAVERAADWIKSASSRSRFSHDIRLPKGKKRLNIDAAMAALQQMGYHLQFNTVRYDSSHHPHWKVTQPNGSIVEMSGQQITDLVYQKGKHMKIGAKAAFAINPVVMESLKSHASKMSDLLRQFIAEAKKSFGNRMDAAWLAQQMATVEGAIRELNNGRVAASVNMAREWADEFAQTYLHHEHTRQLAWIARAIAREPAHVAEMAKAHNVPMSRTGAKAAFAANNVDLWNFLSKSDFVIARQNANDLAKLKKYASMALTMPNFTPPAHQQHGPSLHTMAKDVLADIKNWEQAVYRNKNRSPFSNTGAKAKFGKPRTSTVRRTPSGAFEVVYWDANGKEQSHQLHSSEDRAIAAAKDVARWIDGQFVASRAGAKSTHALPVPTIANPLNRTEHHGDAIAAINAAIKSGNANEARRLFNLYAHTLNSTEKAGVWGIIRKMIGPQFSRAGAKAAFANWQSEVTRKHGVPITEYTAEIGRNQWMIEVAEETGGVVATLYLWNDLRGMERIKSGRLQELQNYAESLSRNKGAKGVANIERRANYSRAGTKAKFENYNGLSQWIAKYGNDINDILNASVSAPRLFEIVRGTDPTQVRNTLHFLYQKMKKREIAAPSWFIRAIREANDSFLDGNDVDLFSRAGAKAAFSWNSDTAHINELLNLVMRELEAGNSGNKQRAKQALQNAQAALFNLHDSFSRAGAKAVMGRTEEEFAEDVQNAAALIASWAKALQTALGLRDYARAKSVVAQIANTATSLSSELKNPATRMSRAGAKAAFGDYGAFHPTAPAVAKPKGEHRYKKGDRVVSREGLNPKTGVVDRPMRDQYGLPTYVVYWDQGGTREVYDAHLTKMSRAGAKSDGLTLAQRIAVAHDAKRMAAR